MKPEDDAGLLAVARAIAGGQPVDWAAIESSGEVSESFRHVLRELRAVAEISEVHRSLPGLSSQLRTAASGSSTSAATIDEGAALGTWGSLTLVEKIGQGAFGVVYRAWDPRLDREVALKLLRHERARANIDPIARTVIHEGRLLARVRHPNVVTVYGADHIDGRVGIAMEFVRGRTLEAVLKDHGPYGAHEAALIGIDVLRALSAVHRAGLVHRDVKPHNVMREQGGRLVLMDFGTGRETAGGDRGDLAGTPLYLAPEVFSGQDATPRSDIYSVGVLLYHLVTNAYPLRAGTLDDVRKAHQQSRRVWLRDARPDLSNQFVDVVERALSPNPDARYESAGAMELALGRVLSSDQHATVAPTPVIDDGAPASHQQSRRFRLMAAGLVAAVAAAIYAIGPWPLAKRSAGSRTAQSTAAVSENATSRRKLALPPYSALGTLSSDSKWLSFSDQSGNLALFELASGAVRPVTHDAVFGQNSQFAGTSVISPAGDWIAYSWWALDGKNELRLIDTEGQRPRVLLRDASIDTIAPIEWSRDGSVILVLTTGADHTKRLALISADDGRVRRIKDLGRTAPLHASLSPDADYVAFDRPREPSAATREIFIAGVDGIEQRILDESGSNNFAPFWTPDGDAIVFLSDRSGSIDLWKIDINQGVRHGPPTILQRNLSRMVPLSLSATGHYVYHETVGAVDVYDAGLTAGGLADVKALTTSHAGSNISSLYSRDGTRLIYASRRGAVRFDRGFTTIIVRDLQSGVEKELTPAMNSFLLRAAAPDGQQVLVQGEDTLGRTGIHRIDLETGDVAAVVLNAPSQNDLRRPDWLADGTILYVNSARRRLLGRNVDAATDRLVWDFGADTINIVADVIGRGYRLSPDGQTLAYTVQTPGKPPSRAIWVRRLPGSEARELLRVTQPELIQLQDWTSDGTAILFTRSRLTNPETSLWRVSLHGDDPEPLNLTLESLRDVSVRPDGSRVTFTAGNPRNEVWVMENFLR